MHVGKGRMVAADYVTEGYIRLQEVCWPTLYHHPNPPVLTFRNQKNLANMKQSSTSYTKSFIEQQILAGRLSGPIPCVAPTSAQNKRSAPANRNPSAPPNHRQNHILLHNQALARAHAHPTHTRIPPRLQSRPSSQPVPSTLARLTSPRNTITLDRNMTDGSEDFWPTKEHMPGVPGMAGIFRVDDKHANKHCSPAERHRREKLIGGILRMLGRGLMVADDAKSKGLVLREPSQKGAKRAAHFALSLQGFSSYTLAALPEGYAIFQTFRDEESGEKGYDTYIYGSSTVQKFDSVRKFIPHLYWVACGCPRDEHCECACCNEE